MPTKYELIMDDPAMYLDTRGNPRSGRRLVFLGPGDVRFELTVTPDEYRNSDTIKAKLKELADAHDRLGSMSL